MDASKIVEIEGMLAGETRMVQRQMLLKQLWRLQRRESSSVEKRDRKRNRVERRNPSSDPIRSGQSTIAVL